MTIDPNKPVLNTDPLNNLYYGDKLVRSFDYLNVNSPEYKNAIPDPITYAGLATLSNESWDENNTGLTEIFSQLNTDDRTNDDAHVADANYLWNSVPISTKNIRPILLDETGNRAIVAVHPGSYFSSTHSVFDDGSLAPSVPSTPFSASYTTLAYGTNGGTCVQAYSRYYPSYNIGILYGNNAEALPQVYLRSSELAMITSFYEITNMQIAGDIMTGTWSRPYHFISGNSGPDSRSSVSLLGYNYETSAAGIGVGGGSLDIDRIERTRLYTIHPPIGYNTTVSNNLGLSFDTYYESVNCRGNSNHIYLNFNKEGTRLYYLRNFLHHNVDEASNFYQVRKDPRSSTNQPDDYVYLKGVYPDRNHSEYKYSSMINVLHLDTPWDITSVSKHEMVDINESGTKDRISFAFTVDSNEDIKTASLNIGNYSSASQSLESMLSSSTGANDLHIEEYTPSFSGSFSMDSKEVIIDPTTGADYSSLGNSFHLISDKTDFLNEEYNSKFLVHDSDNVSAESTTLSDPDWGKYQPIVPDYNAKVDNPFYVNLDIHPSTEENINWKLIRGGYTNVNTKYPDLSFAYRFYEANDQVDWQSLTQKNPYLILSTTNRSFAVIKKLNNPMIMQDSADASFDTKLISTTGADKADHYFSYMGGNIDSSYTFSKPEDLSFYEKTNDGFKLIDLNIALGTNAFLMKNNEAITRTTDSDFFEFLSNYT